MRGYRQRWVTGPGRARQRRAGQGRVAHSGDGQATFASMRHGLRGHGHSRRKERQGTALTLRWWTGGRVDAKRRSEASMREHRVNRERDLRPDPGTGSLALWVGRSEHRVASLASGRLGPCAVRPLTEGDPGEPCTGPGPWAQTRPCSRCGCDTVMRARTRPGILVLSLCHRPARPDNNPIQRNRRTVFHGARHSAAVLHRVPRH